MSTAFARKVNISESSLYEIYSKLSKKIEDNPDLLISFWRRRPLNTNREAGNTVNIYVFDGYINSWGTYILNKYNKRITPEEIIAIVTSGSTLDSNIVNATCDVDYELNNFCGTVHVRRKR